jgi:hypothetical protein
MPSPSVVEQVALQLLYSWPSVCPKNKRLGGLGLTLHQRKTCLWSTFATSMKHWCKMSLTKDPEALCFTSKDLEVDWDKVERASPLVESAFTHDRQNESVIAKARRLEQFYGYMVNFLRCDTCCRWSHCETRLYSNAWSLLVRHFAEQCLSWSCSCGNFANHSIFRTKFCIAHFVSCCNADTHKYLAVALKQRFKHRLAYERLCMESLSITVNQMLEKFSDDDWVLKLSYQFQCVPFIPFRQDQHKKSPTLSARSICSHDSN